MNITNSILNLSSLKSNKLKFNFFLTILILLYLFFCYLMFRITIQYIPYDTDVAFLRIKQDVIDSPFYKLAFFTHVYTAMFVLIAGLTQFSTQIRIHLREIHRYSGWVYAFTVLFLAGPSGFYMGVFANGGLISQTAFCILAVLWIYFTTRAVSSAVKRDFVSHRKYMIRSFALTLSAITLRAWKYILVLFLQPKPMDAYQLVAWLGWIPNLIIAEIIIYKLYNKRKYQR